MPNPFDQFDQPQAGPSVLIPAAPDKPPVGFRRTANGGLEPIPGGPADPSTKPQTPNLPVGWRMNPQTGAAERIPGLPGNSDTTTPKISAKERADAIGGYKSAQALRRYVSDLQQKFQAGPGATKGIAGLQDYLPTTANRQFDAAGNAARGIVGQALGFTGGQLNTATEANMAVGPFLPQADDRDEVILDKIQRLSNLAEQAEQRSVAILGGQPDQNGNAHPVAAQTPAPQGGQVLDGNAPGNLTTGAGYQPDPALAGAQQKYLAMLQAGAGTDKIIGFLKDAGVPLDPALMMSVQKQVEFRKANPNVPVSKYDTDMIGMRWHPGSSVIGQMGNSPLGAGVVAAGNALTGGFSDELIGATGGNQEQAELAKQMLAQQYPGATLAGTVGGSALGMGGLNAGLRFAGGRLGSLATAGGGIGGDALYGSAFGAGENNDNRGIGALAGGASAIGGNLVGRGLVSGIGRGVRGVQNADVGYLADRGVRMTPGQILGQGGPMGRGTRAVEDTLESVPFLGAAIKSRKLEGLKDFNREAFKDALAPIGGEVQDQIGQEAIGQAQDAVSDSYGNALNGTMIRADLPFVQQAVRAAHMGQSVPTMGDQFGYLVKNKIGPLFLSNRSLDGAGFQAALQTTRKAAKDFSGQGAMGSEAADFMGDLGNAFTGLAERQAPEVMPGLRAANSANRNVSVLGDAVNGAINAKNEIGMFTPAQLGRASIANTKKFSGTRAASRGDYPFSELHQSGQQVLPNEVPNSGTTDRALATLVLPGALGGAAAGSEYFNLPAPVTGALAGLSLLSTRKGNDLVQTLLTSRSPQARELGERILMQRRLGGMFGAGATVPMVAGQ